MNEKPIISIDLVKQLIPQKSPFDMVDELLDFQEKDIVTRFFIKENQLFLENEFFNVSGMLENVAQSIALHTSYDYHLKGIKAPIGYIGAISNVAVFQQPKVSSSITTKVHIIQEFMGVTLIGGELWCNDALCLKTNMKTFIAHN
jgi:hypothetical protein